MDNPPNRLERMEIRRVLRNQQERHVYVRPSHRGAAYLIAYVCFECRKSWKLSGDFEHKCPQCQKPLSMMGRAFRTPPNSNRNQWKKVQKLWEAGFSFWGYGRNPDIEPYPANLSDVDAFIDRNPNYPGRVTR